jgi:hypothetical protein
MYTKFFVGKPKGKGPHGRSWRRREDNIRMDRRKIGWEVVAWMHVVQNRDQWRALYEHSDETSGSVKCGEFIDQMSD